MPRQTTTPRRSPRLNPTPDPSNPSFQSSISLEARAASTDQLWIGSEQQQHARRALLYFSASWLALVLAGVLLHEGSAAHGSHEDVVAVQRRLPLAGFDRIIRHTGAVLWLIPFLLRAAATYYTTSEAAPRRAQHFYRAFLLYVVLSVLRTAVYILQSRGIPLIFGTDVNKHTDYMSDHIFLGASLSAILTAEAVVGFLDAKPLSKERSSLVPKLQTAGWISATTLFSLTAWDMFFTARYFHPRLESSAAAILGLLCFQLPIGFLLSFDVSSSKLVAQNS